MDLVDRKAFIIDDISQASSLSSIYNDAFNVWSGDGLHPSYFEDVILSNEGNIKIYGINNIYNSLIGFAYYKLVYGAAKLDTLAVMNRYQKMKVGSFLFRESFFDLVSNEKVKLVTADALSIYPVLSFYKSCGFTNMDGTPIDISHGSNHLTKIRIGAK